jgi:hypothetical protein
MSDPITIEDIYKLFQRSQEEADRRFAEADRRAAEIDRRWTAETTILQYFYKWFRTTIRTTICGTLIINKA